MPVTAIPALSSDLVLADTNQSTGKRWFVHSVTGFDNATSGTTPTTPFATIDYAVDQCTHDKGDIIYVMPGHVETWGAVTGLALNIRGVKVIGLGEGVDRPTINFGNTASAISISAGGVTMENILLVSTIDLVAAPLTITGADCCLRKIEWRDNTNIEFVRGLITAATASRLLVDDCFYNGYVGGDACVNAIRLVGTSAARIKDCRFIGTFTTGIIEFHTTLSPKVTIERCIFYNAGTALTKDIINTVAGSTYDLAGCYDMQSGQEITGSHITPIVSLSALANRGVEVTRATAALPQGAAVTIFTVYGGAVIINDIIGYITTNIGAVPNATKLQLAAATDLCATVELNNAQAGGMLRITGTPGDAMVLALANSVKPIQAIPLIVEATTISLRCAGSDGGGGRCAWTIHYTPIQSGAFVLAS
jgi:hypothetical protein